MPRSVDREDESPSETILAGSLATKTLLKRNYLFRGLADVALERLAALATRRTYAKGAVIFSQGDPGDALYGVASGRIRISATAAPIVTTRCTATETRPGTNFVSACA